MIIALCGQSLSGKSTIGNALGARLGFPPIRSCGEVVKNRACELNLSLEGLPVHEHLEIDAETIRWSEKQSGLAIVEGRYLDYVLSRARADIQLIELVSDGMAREQRWARRIGRKLSSGERKVKDAADRDFVAMMYAESPPLVPTLQVDTTVADVAKCVSEILDWLILSNAR